MQNRPDSRIPKNVEFQHFPNRMDLQTVIFRIQNMAVFLKEIAINALKSYEI